MNSGTGQVTCSKELTIDHLCEARSVVLTFVCFGPRSVFGPGQTGAWRVLSQDMFWFFLLVYIHA